MTSPNQSHAEPMDETALADTIAGVMTLRAVMMDTHPPPNPRCGAAARKLTALMDDESADLRARGLAAAVLMEPSWSTFSTTLTPRRVKKRAREILDRAAGEHLATLPG